MPVLEHRGDCVASWVYLHAEGTILCRGCNRRYVSTPERQFVVAFELILSQHMQRLANDGAAILAAERGS